MEVYFDNAATTRIRHEVVDEIKNCLLETYGNPSSTHSFGRSAKSKLENARKVIASYLNASPQEIIFTSGGTESDNMLIRCSVKDMGVTTIISSRIEHHAVLHTLDDLESSGINIKYVKTNNKGQVDFQDLERLLKEDNSKKLVTLMYVNNEIGTILDLERVGLLCKELNALFHTDAVQGVAHFNIDVKKYNIDFLSAAAHKFHGPKGVGFSYVKKNTGINPFIRGGAQERGLRAGTEALPNIIGMEKAISLSYDNLNEEKVYIQSIKDYFIKSIKKIFPNVQFNGCSSDSEESTYTLINIAIPVIKKKASLLDFQLDLKGIACSKGSACQSGSNQGSHVLKEVQGEKNNDWPSLRFSFSSYNSKKEVDYLMGVLKEFS
jgi:cysteine desulfurase|tara:strand:+ start:3103 stop:4239 length:1137 start_codon:yes stop_codon:yes gene_type:complete